MVLPFGLFHRRILFSRRFKSYLKIQKLKNPDIPDFLIAKLCKSRAIYEKGNGVALDPGVHFALAGCGRSYKVRITIPVGSAEEFVYSDEEISAVGSKITVYSGDGLGDTEVALLPADAREFDVPKGKWFKVGVSVQNPTDANINVYAEVKGTEIRIE